MSWWQIFFFTDRSLSKHKITFTLYFLHKRPCNPAFLHIGPCFYLRAYFTLWPNPSTHLAQKDLKCRKIFKNTLNIYVYYIQGLVCTNPITWMSQDYPSSSSWNAKTSSETSPSVSSGSLLHHCREKIYYSILRQQLVLSAVLL
jgi:hypothetical protein